MHTGENIYDTCEYLTPQFLKGNDPISAKSGAQILSLNLA